MKPTDEREIAAFRASPGPLPPLTERIERGDAGALEFARLMHQLLLVHADRRGFAYVPVPLTGNGIGADGFAREGMPGLGGPVAFSFKWIGADVHKPGNRARIREALKRASADRKALRHWILVTPLDLAPADRAWFGKLKRPKGISIHHWGKKEIDELLLGCPPLLARYHPDAARPHLDGYDGADFRELARSYRAQVAIAHGRLKTIGLPPETVRERDSRADLKLRDLFIPLRLVPDGADGAPRDLARVLAGGSGVVLGDPGMGKSTLLAYLALLFSGGASLEGFSPPAEVIPLFVSLRDFVRLQRADPDLTFLGYLETHARRHLQIPEAHWAFFEASLRMGEAVVLFDGLDEVGGEAARYRIATAIRAFRGQFPASLYWITSRIYGYTSSVRLSGEGFSHYRIGQLDDEQVDGFIARWYALQIPDDPAERAARAASLREAVHRTPSVRRLASNPLLLTLMAFIHHGLRKLPQDRGELYEKCVEMLLKTWQEARRDDPAAPSALGDLKLHVQTQKDYLAHLAFSVQERKQAGADEEARGLFSRADALDCLEARHWQRAVRDRPSLTRAEAREEMTRFLEYIGDETGLLIDRGGDQLSFIHLSFQEYLSAWVFTCGTSTPSGPSFFEEHLGDPAWEEVLLLRLYIVLEAPGGGGTDEFDRVVARLLRALETRSSPEGWLTLVRALRDDLEFTETNRKLILARALGFWLEAPRFSGTWFTAIEEVRLFATRTKGVLRAVLAEARAREPGARAIACLHLEARLFGFPEGAAEDLKRRADLPEMLPDLVAFLGEPGILSLLEDRATVGHWAAGLCALDGPALHRLTLGWATAPVAQAATEAAIGLLWGKILEDLGSRARFAAPRRGKDGAHLFDRPGCVLAQTPLSSATLPLSGVRALPEEISLGAASARAPRLCASLARDRLDRARGAMPWGELNAWAARFVDAQLAAFADKQALDPTAARSLAATFAHDFVRDFGRDLSRAFSRDFSRDFGADFARAFGPDLVRAFGRAFSRAFGRRRGRDFVRDFVRAASGAFDRDFMADFIHAFGRPVARAFGRAFGVDPDKADWESAWTRVMEDEKNQSRLFQHADFWVWASYRSSQDGLDPDMPSSDLCLQLNNPLGLPLLLMDLWSAAALQHVFSMFRHLAVIHPDGEVSDEAMDAWLARHPIEVYGVAFAWDEHVATFTRSRGSLAGPEGALFLAHAAHARLMTGLACDLPIAPDLGDPRVRFSHALSELARFRDAEIHARTLEEILRDPGVDLRPILEAAGLSVGRATASDKPADPARSPSIPPRPETERPALFTWLHLSDLQIGHRDARWDQALVLDALRKDIAARTSQGIPSPEAIVITGDVASTGAADEYATAQRWILDVADQLGIEQTRVFVVPGNHDVDRSADRSKRSVARLVDNLREGRESLDTILGDPDEREILARRMRPYLSFAEAFASTQKPDPLFWASPLVAASGIRVRVIGLSTALLAADDLDKGKLRLGKAALSATLTGLPENELVMVLTHHPFRDGWLSDQREADAWIKGRAHVHLFGHVHEADSEDARSGAGSSLIRVAAGAAYDPKLPGIRASHGYSFASVSAASDGALRLRIWPRRWSEKNKSFTIDVESTSPEQAYAEHPLPGLRLSLVMSAPAGR